MIPDPRAVISDPIFLIPDPTLLIPDRTYLVTTLIYTRNDLNTVSERKPLEVLSPPQRPPTVALGRNALPFSLSGAPASLFYLFTGVY